MTDTHNHVAAVFCGSRNGTKPAYRAHAMHLATLLCEKGIPVVYGGGGKGLMGAVADTVLAHNGRITGVMPRMLVDVEHQHQGLTDFLITEDMHQRKRIMYEQCTFAVVLPGGFGTMDELFEMLTWNQLSIHDKRIHLLNTEGYYDHLIGHMRHMEEDGFLYDSVTNRILIHEEPEGVLRALEG
jgi:uncharacterized protein (TIGR00730 family)